MTVILIIMLVHKEITFSDFVIPLNASEASREVNNIIRLKSRIFSHHRFGFRCLNVNRFLNAKRAEKNCGANRGKRVASKCITTSEWLQKTASIYLIAYNNRRKGSESQRYPAETTNWWKKNYPFTARKLESMRFCFNRELKRDENTLNAVDNNGDNFRERWKDCDALGANSADANIDDKKPSFRCKTKKQKSISHLRKNKSPFY